MSASTDSGLHQIDMARQLAILGISDQNALTSGCYLIDLTIDRPPAAALRLFGSLRVDWQDGAATISGDLYNTQPLNGLPVPNQIVPAFPHSSYRSYLRALRVTERPGPPARLELHLGRQRLDDEQRQWSTEPELTLVLGRIAGPIGGPAGGDRRTGDIEDEQGNPIGHARLNRVSDFLRRAVVEIDRTPASPAPLANGAGVDWASLFAGAGWEISVVESGQPLTKPESTPKWANHELHQMMVEFQQRRDGGGDWRHYLACVELLESAERGIMFDPGGTDSANMPREGAAVSSGWWPREDESDVWGRIRERLSLSLEQATFGQATLPYFRTAAHEIGHTMGLGHNRFGPFIMRTTDRLDNNDTFPANVQFAFSDVDHGRLRHWPDPYVRPGGVVVEANELLDEAGPSALDHELRLQVRPLSPVVPLGAPVRVRFRVKNKASKAVTLPSLSLKSGHVRGRVDPPGGDPRALRPIILRLDSEDAGPALDRGAAEHHWITLLRGPQGALFPSPGLHRIVIELRREQADGTPVMASGQTHVLVSATAEKSHARTVHRVLSTPDALLVLALGGRHLKQGIKAIKTALSDRLLRPHFGVVEAKRRGGLGKPLKRVLEVLDKHTVMSVAELRRLAELVRDRRQKAGNKKAFMKKKAHRRLVKLLRYHAGKLRPFDKGLEKKIRKIIYR